MWRVYRWLPVVACILFASACRPKYPKCSNDKDCHANEYCVDGQCQQCRTDNDCPAGGTCKGGRCEPARAVPQVLACTDDAQCPKGQSCIGGQCRPCAADGDCGEGGRCVEGRCQRGKPSCTLEPVYFDFNEYALTTDGTSAIDHDAECIKQSGRGATLTGHTDPRGTEEYNLALSDKRAQSVKERLSRLGVTASMRVVARGEMDAAGTDEAGWAKDRRVDVSW